MLVIIAGTRHKVDPVILEDAIKESGYDITCVLSGANRSNKDSVDHHGERWAQGHGIDVRLFPAAWKHYGRAAGPMRNEEMAKAGEALIALPCKHSTGTHDMIERARRHGLFVYQKEIPCQSKPRVRKTSTS